jgi:serine/threonine protein kinase
VTDVKGVPFIRRSYIYGQPLSFYTCKENILDRDTALRVILEIAQNLQFLLFNKVLYLDLRAENVLLRPQGISFPDLGLSRFIKDENADTLRVVMAHPRYAAPETTDNRATATTPVFQLGILAQELLTGTHPFDCSPGALAGDDWCIDVERYLIGIRDRAPKWVELGFIDQMLNKDGEKRPTISDCAAEFKAMVTPKSYISRKGIPGVPKEKNTILFPARMGIPHIGHIEYIRRLIDLGAHVCIAISQSYTLSDRDPIHKWFVMKMVAQSLFKIGYPKESFSFYLVPFPANFPEKKLYYQMMPNADDIIAVASSNPTVHEIFPEFEIIEQVHLLGSEGEAFEPLSWGEVLRSAVKSEDRKTFDTYVAYGVEDILTFEELRALYHEQTIVYVPGAVRAVLHSAQGQVITQCRVGKYSTPEESLLKNIPDSIIVDPYAKFTKAFVNADAVQIKYLSTEFDGTDEIIHFQIM